MVFNLFSDVKKFIEQQESERAYKLYDLLENLQTYTLEHLLKTKDVKKIEKKYGVYEVRLRVNKEEYRFLGGFRGGTLYLCVSFKKKRKENTQRQNRPFN